MEQSGIQELVNPSGTNYGKIAKETEPRHDSNSTMHIKFNHFLKNLISCLISLIVAVLCRLYQQRMMFAPMTMTVIDPSHNRHENHRLISSGQQTNGGQPGGVAGTHHSKSSSTTTGSGLGPIDDRGGIQGEMERGPEPT